MSATLNWDGDAQRVRTIREVLEISMSDARDALQLHRDGTCPDPLVGAYFVHARALAINVKGGAAERQAWNLKFAVGHAEAMERARPELSVLRTIGEPIAGMKP